jgi:hypothetical protein
MLDKKGIYNLLDQYDIIYETSEHAPVYTIEELS